MPYKIKLNRRNNSIRVTHTTQNIKLKHSGPRGKQGIQGIQGITGAGMPTGGTTDQVLQKASGEDYDFKWLNPTYSDKTFLYEFAVSNVITVEHNLGKYPAVSVTDSAGDEVEGDIIHINTNSLVVSFAAPFSGRVLCN